MQALRDDKSRVCLHHAAERQAEDVRATVAVRSGVLLTRDSVNDRCQQMASLLRGLQSYANADDAGRISDLLEAVGFGQSTLRGVQVLNVTPGRRGDFRNPTHNSILDP